ncbi:hypothetical protein ACFQMA_00945 [Halosimplex aquaticum]|uniref:Uncharacterized protein n=1 Tax=Halosimplex aquaticum TaxID=3026162 RepID=A0ABD5XTG9_9EURY|nr:hypothetical protein [Halosimplex aquaticum]
MKKGVLASGALALGASGSALAQEETDDGEDDSGTTPTDEGTTTAEDGGASGDLDDEWQALTFIDNYHSKAWFTFVSGVIEWAPNYGDVQSSYFSEYNTYQIRWLNTDEVVPLFVAEDANIGEYDEDLGFIPDADDDENQPQLFEMNREWRPFGDSDRLITVSASPVVEEVEDDVLADQDWWQQTGDDSTATSTESGN